LSICIIGGFSRRVQLSKLVSSLRICYVGDYTHSSDAKFYVFIPFCGVMNGCGEIIMYVVYVVSCVGISFLPAMGYCGCSCSTVLLVLVSLWVVH
jgi:hypothetical protein